MGRFLMVIQPIFAIFCFFRESIVPFLKYDTDGVSSPRR